MRHWLWRIRVWLHMESPTRHFEDLRDVYYHKLMEVAFECGHIPPGVASFDKLCYDAVMGHEHARTLLHNLGGGLH